MLIINNKLILDRSYIAGFKSEKVGIYAHSLAAAKQKAIEHFKPKKRDSNLIWVELSMENDYDCK